MSSSGSASRSSGQAGDIVVTGLGMRTAVGNDTVQTCATVRCGISRYVEWPYLAVGQEDAKIPAAALEPLLVDGTWVEKFSVVTEQPLHEALWQAGLHDGKQWKHRFGEGAKLGAWLAVPAPGRAGVTPELEREFAEMIKATCVQPATADVVQVVAMDHAAGLVAVGRAMQALLQGLVKVAVVVGMDSQLSSAWLEELDERAVLRHESRGVGLIAGEAGGVVILERRADAQRRGATPLLTLGALAIDREEVPIGPEHPITATGMSRAVKKCLAARNGGRDVRRVIVDLTGERWRALEWSLVEARCFGQFEEGWEQWHPADCYGDVGAASGVLALGVAARAYARGYGGTGAMLLSSTSLGGERAAVIVAPPDQTG